MNKKIFGILIICLFIGATFIPNINGLNNLVKSSDTESEKSTFNNDILLEYSAGYKIKHDTYKNIYPLEEPTQNLLDNFDWRNYNGKDWTTPAKNQGNCGCCWAFSAVGALESVINIVEGDPDLDLDLSEQYVLSCLPIAGSCGGGDPYLAFECILDDGAYGNYVNGIIYEQCLPYQADDSIPCSDKCINWKENLIPISGCGEALNPEIDEIKNKIINDGPIVSCVFLYANIVNPSSFDENGVYRPDDNTDVVGPHGIVVVGYQDTPDNPNYEGFWICKNSWGPDWGPWNNGFFGIAYNQLGFYMSDEVYIIWVEYINQSSNFPPKQPTITGETDGKIDTGYEYRFMSTDPEGDNIEYCIDWGDNTGEVCIGPNTSGEEATAEHSWSEKDNYTIKAKARDVNGAESGWATLEVKISKGKAKEHLFLSWFLEKLIYRFPFLEKIINQIV